MEGKVYTLYICILLCLKTGNLFQDCAKICWTYGDKSVRITRRKRICTLLIFDFYKFILLPRKDWCAPILFNVRKHCKSQDTYYKIKIKLICRFKRYSRFSTDFHITRVPTSGQERFLSKSRNGIGNGWIQC